MRVLMLKNRLRRLLKMLWLLCLVIGILRWELLLFRLRRLLICMFWLWFRRILLLRLIMRLTRGRRIRLRGFCSIIWDRIRCRCLLLSSRLLLNRNLSLYNRFSWWQIMLKIMSAASKSILSYLISSKKDLN